MTDPGTAWELATITFKLGLLSFGGGSAVLGEMQRDIVGRGWLTHQQFMEAYALGQAIPGSGTLYMLPLGYRIAGLSGAIAAFLAFFVPPAIITVVACALWSRVRHMRWLAAARTAVLPIGVGLSIASAFALTTAGLGDLRTIAMAGVSLLVFWRTSVPTPVVLLAGATIGAAWLQ